MILSERIRLFLHSIAQGGCRGLALGLTLVCLATVHATELRFKNGDRLTGKVLRQAEGMIHFRSPLLGELVIPESEVTMTPATPVESLAGLPPARKPVEAPPETPDPAEGEVIKPTTPRIKGTLELGFNNQSGRANTTNFSLRGEAEYSRKEHHYRATARYLYGESDNALSSDRRDASFRWRRDLSPRMFNQATTSYFSDGVALVGINVEQNAGMGFKFLQNERSQASVGGGLTLQYREADGIEDATSILGEFFQDYSWKINGRMTFSQTLNALYSPDAYNRLANTVANEEGDNYKIRFNSALQGKLSERISLNLRYEYEYDNAILDKAHRSDHRISSSVGYSF